jgi:hypothetical protein
MKTHANQLIQASGWLLWKFAVYRTWPHLCLCPYNGGYGYGDGGRLQC